MTVAPAGWRRDRGGWSRPLVDGRRVWVRVTERDDGDLHIGGEPTTLAARRARVAPGSWVWLRQVHGAEVVVARAGGPNGDGPSPVAGAAADAAVTAEVGPVLVVHTADCAPVALWSEAGLVGVAHVGWRGLEAGVLDRTVEAMVAQGGPPTGALLGPCIEAACYAFGPEDLARVAARVGPRVVGRTTHGAPALDLSAGVRTRLAAHGIPLDETLWRCTACDRRWWSHRARADRGRSALVARLEAEPSGGRGWGDEVRR